MEFEPNSLSPFVKSIERALMPAPVHVVFVNDNFASVLPELRCQATELHGNPTEKLGVFLGKNWSCYTGDQIHKVSPLISRFLLHSLHNCLASPVKSTTENIILTGKTGRSLFAFSKEVGWLQIKGLSLVRQDGPHEYWHEPHVPTDFIRNKGLGGLQGARDVVLDYLRSSRCSNGAQSGIRTRELMAFGLLRETIVRSDTKEFNDILGIRLATVRYDNPNIPPKSLSLVSVEELVVHGLIDPQDWPTVSIWKIRHPLRISDIRTDNWKTETFAQFSEMVRSFMLADDNENLRILGGLWEERELADTYNLRRFNSVYLRWFANQIGLSCKTMEEKGVSHAYPGTHQLTILGEIVDFEGISLLANSEQSWKQIISDYSMKFLPYVDIDIYADVANDFAKGLQGVDIIEDLLA